MHLPTEYDWLELRQSSLLYAHHIQPLKHSMGVSHVDWHRGVAQHPAYYRIRRFLADADEENQNTYQQH